jgi:molybdopterin molybdotransferase
MLSLEQARDAILKNIRAGTARERVPLAEAVGRYLAEAPVARVDNPAFDNSAMDGYAVKLADLAAHDFRLPVRGESSCGEAPATLSPGTTMRIFTGAPLPAGADTIVIQEDVQAQDGHVVLPHNIGLGQHVRRRGEDFRAGEALLRPGQTLDAGKLALLATAGVDTVEVFRRARVLVVATGNELVAPGQPLSPGQIYESNRLATLLQARALGAEAVDGGTVRDDAEALRRLLRGAGGYADGNGARAAGRDGSPTPFGRSSCRNAEPDGGFDFVITSGGASVGDHDLVKQVFAEIGEINFWKARIKPGKPIAFGRIGERTHFFALPGNPVSSLVTFLLFVEPALRAWHHAAGERLALAATARNGFRRRAGRTEFLRARLYSENGRLMAEMLKGQGSHQLRPMADMNGFIRVEAESEGFEAGATVTAIPLLSG